MVVQFATLFGSCLLMAATGPSIAPPRSVMLAEQIVTQLYLEPLDSANAKLTTVLERSETEFSPAQVSVRAVLDSEEILVVSFEFVGDTATFLVAKGPLFAKAEGADGPQLLARRRKALRAIERLNGWRCDITRRPAAKPGFSEARCFDSSPGPYSSDTVNLVFEELGGLLYMLGSPGPPPFEHQSRCRLTPRCSGQQPGVRPVVAAELIRR